MEDFRYHIQKLVYEDALFRTYEGVSKDDGKLILVKIPKDSIDYFLCREFEFAKEIYDINAILPLELIIHNSDTIAIYEHFQGKPLSIIIEKKISINDRLRLAVLIVKAFANIHKEFIHRDIRPENIWVSPNYGTVKITGFGCAMRVSEKKEVALPIFPNEGLAYLAPEALANINRVTCTRRDFYSIGMVLHLLFAGKLPSEAGVNYKLIESQLRHAELLEDNQTIRMSEYIGKIISKMIARSLGERIQNLDVILDDLNNLLTWEYDKQVSKDIEGAKHEENALKSEKNDAEILPTDHGYGWCKEAINNARALIYMQDCSGRIQYLNNIFLNSIGKKMEDLIGKKFHEICDKTDFSEVIENNEMVITTQKSIEFEETFFCPQGEKHFISGKSPIFDDNGDVSGIFGILIDVTERTEIENEMEKLIEELQNRNSELTNLLFVVSHDMRSPLVNVVGFADRLKNQIEIIKDILNNNPSLENDLKELNGLLSEKIPSILKHIVSGTNKMDVLIQGVLKYSRASRANLNKQNIYAEPLIKSIIETFKYQLDEISAQVEIGEVPILYGDLQHISQVISNLFENAVRYREPSRKLLIKITGVDEGEKVHLMMEDNGLGIEEENQKKIWDLFQRLKNVSDIKGEGIGLTLAKKIIERHDGTIWVHSKLGQGSTFHIMLPKSNDSDALEICD